MKRPDPHSCKEQHFPWHIALTRNKRFEEQNGQCYYCGKFMWIPGEFIDDTGEIRLSGRRADSCTAEHIIPRKHGGTDDEDNIVCSCFECNMERGNIPHDDFRMLRLASVWYWKFHARAYGRSLDKGLTNVVMLDAIDKHGRPHPMWLGLSKSEFFDTPVTQLDTKKRRKKKQTPKPIQGATHRHFKLKQRRDRLEKQTSRGVPFNVQMVNLIECFAPVVYI